MSNDQHFLNGIKIPRDEDGVPASLLIGLVDGNEGGHFAAISVNSSGQLAVNTATATAPTAPTFFLMHNAITAPIPFPSNALAVYSALGKSLLIVDVTVSAGGSVTIEPLVWSSTFNEYIPGDPSPSITTTSRYVLDIQSPSDIYILPTAVSGTISVAVSGV